MSTPTTLSPAAKNTRNVSHKVASSQKIKSPKLKAKPIKAIVPTRFSYLVRCKHDLKNEAGCPMCRLVHLVTKKHFEDEKEEIRMAHEQSIINRAQLRLTLLMRWARSQSVLYNKHVESPTFEVVFSRSLARLLVDEDSIGHRKNPMDFKELVRILERRNRIHEVGHFAAVFLQSRIRKYLAKRYVRRVALRRFEYVPATRRKEAFFVDSKWNRKWNRTPKLLMDETPATPRTVERRLAADDRVRTARFEVYTKAVKREFRNRSEEDIWEHEEATVRFLRQLSVMRDLVRIAMTNLTRSRLNALAKTEAEKLQQQMVSQQQQSGGRRGGGGEGSFDARSHSHSSKLMNPATSGSSKFNSISDAAAGGQSMDTTPAATAAQSFDPLTSPLLPVWVSLSAPAMCARQLGLALVLATVPSPATGAVACRKEPDSDAEPRVSAAASSNPKYTSPSTYYAAAAAAVAATAAVSAGGANGRRNSVSPAARRNSVVASPNPPGGSPTTTISSAAKGTSTKVRSSGSGSYSTGTGTGFITGVAQLHRALLFLESSIWQSLRCDSPEEVLSKLLLEDLRPTYESVMNITQDDKYIWHGKLGHVAGGTDWNPSTAKNGNDLSNNFGSSLSLLTAGTGLPVDYDDNSSLASIDSGEFDIEGEFESEVLPFSLHIRPYIPERECSGLFRLFFYGDELIAVSAMSPWAFYSEVTWLSTIILFFPLKTFF
jgi:hypothetical protein